MIQNTQSNSQKPLLIFLTGLLLACILCGLAGLALNASAASSPMMDLNTQVCAGITTTPKWQIGVSWMSPVSSYMPPLTYSPYAACLDIPTSWSSVLAPNVVGEWMFPP